MELLHNENNGNGIMSLTSGMIEDAHQLAQQEFALVKSEFRQELNSLKIAYAGMAIAMVIFFVGLIPLPFLVTEFLLYLTPETFPVWVAELCASILFLGVGVGVLFFAKNYRSA
jgi:drug/metabolite transporter (DMT)-like permease